MKRSPNRDLSLTTRHHELVESVRGLILSIAVNLVKSHPLAKLEDVITLAEDGAIAAAQDYREGESASFTTFAWSRIWGSAKNGLARERREASIPARLSEGMAEGRRHALDYAEGQRDTSDPFHDTEQDDARRPAEALDGLCAAYVIGFTMGQPAGTPEAEARRAEVRASVATLKDRDDTVVSAYVFDGKSFAQIAAEQPGGMTRVMVQRQYHAAIGRLAKRLAKVVD